MGSFADMWAIFSDSVFGKGTKQSLKRLQYINIYYIGTLNHGYSYHCNFILM